MIVKATDSPEEPRGHLLHVNHQEPSKCLLERSRNSLREVAGAQTGNGEVEAATGAYGTMGTSKKEGAVLAPSDSIQGWGERLAATLGAPGNSETRCRTLDLRMTASLEDVLDRTRSRHRKDSR